MHKQPVLVKFANWILRRYESNHLNKISSDVPTGAISGRSTKMDRMEDTISFTVHPASGGYVVESNYYDNKTDRHKRNLHIITSQEDFSEELGKAVFMDMLKHR